MNIATFLIALIIATLFVLAIRYLAKNGMCAACEDKKACHSAKEAGDPGLSSACGGKCSSCRYEAQELKAAADRHQTNA